MEVTRRWLREKARELNKQDKEILQRLFAQGKCMHRRITSSTSYTYCGRPAERYGPAKIIYCSAHRSQ